MRGKTFLLFLFLLLQVANLAYGSDLDNILKEKKVSIADFFICHLKNRIKCIEGDSEGNICSKSIIFDEQNNIFTITINLEDSDSLLTGFYDSNEKDKEKILKMAVDEIAIFLGVLPLEKASGQLKYGEIQKINNLPLDNESADKLKEHISNNTIIELFVRHKNLVYWVLRGIDSKKEVIILDPTKNREN